MTEREKEEVLRQRQLAFIGRMLTAFTGKISRHLAALQASADRLAHLLEKANQETEEDKKKLADLLSTIERHLEIFSRRTQHLNRFAQRMGLLPCTFEPREVIEEAVLFSTRLADVRKVSLRLDADETSPNLCSNPVYIHSLVSILIHTMLERVSEKGEVIVSTAPSDKGLRISVAGLGTLEPLAPSESEAGFGYWTIAQQIAASLGGNLQPAAIEHDTRRISVFLPSEIVSENSDPVCVGQKRKP
ncbi:MAG: hypothetical protein PVG99_15180 [Desulfobacteraceae bacterium]|jgi:C4-dicarboxylate-specific signal transduction histidine kinase